MKIIGLLAGLLAASLATGSASAQTLATVQARGALNCGINPGLVGFAWQDANGTWQGFDVAVCRAVAAAVLGDPSAVNFTRATARDRFDILNAGTVDLLARNTPWTFSRDVGLKLEFAGINYYDGQGLMVPADLGVTSAKELNGHAICIQPGTPSEANLAEFFRANNLTYEPVRVDTDAAAQDAYLGGTCSVYTRDAAGLAATRAGFKDPSAHVILPEIISKEPLGPVVRHGDGAWADIVRWTLNALIAAEELGVHSANIDELAQGTDSLEIDRLLGRTGDLGAMLGLSADWAYNAIKAGGNYGEIFERHIGQSTPIGLARGLNAQWMDGGLLYAPPFR